MLPSVVTSVDSTSGASLPASDNMIPILAASGLLVDSVPAQNHWSCSLNSRQFRELLPVNRSGSGSLHKFEVIIRSQSMLHF